MPDPTTPTHAAQAAPAPGSDALLRDTLKRCSAQTVEAALAFRKSGNVSLVPVVVMGIVERFLDPDVAEKLAGGSDSLRFMEDLGLDSLTMIEAIMMVEESLGISIKNEELAGLRTVGDLKTFIGAKISGIDAEPKADFYPVEEIAAAMPQQDPFLFLEEATLDGATASGKYAISGNEYFLKGHFKGDPVFPASIMIEALGQLAVFYLFKKRAAAQQPGAQVYFVGSDGIRCHRVCRPGDVLEMRVELKRERAPLLMFSGQISVNGEKAVSAEEITLALAPADAGRPARNGSKPE